MLSETLPKRQLKSKAYTSKTLYKVGISAESIGIFGLYERSDARRIGQ